MSFRARSSYGRPVPHSAFAYAGAFKQPLAAFLSLPPHPAQAAWLALAPSAIIRRRASIKPTASGIAVNTVAPGAIETDLLGGAVRDMPDLNRTFAGMTTLGRVGVPDDIGARIASLLTGANRWINAQRIEVSGGQVI